MSESGDRPTRQIVLDSALLVTFGATILYILGTAFRLVRLNEIGVPFEFVRQWSVQEYTLAGGLFIAGLAPLFLIADVLLTAFPAGRRRVFAAIARPSYARIALLGLYLVFIALLVIIPVGKRFAHTTVHYRVVKFVPAAGISDIPVLNTYYVSSNDRDVVFMQRWADPNSPLIIVPRERLAAVELRRDTASGNRSLP